MSAVAAPTIASPRRGRAHAWADRAASVLLAFVLVLLALGLGLRATGHGALVDYSDSMRPAISAGDVLITRGAEAGALRPGQIATIEDPADGRLITHRVTGVRRAGERVVVTTKGDANSASERWDLRADRDVRTLAARIPAAGHAIMWIASGGFRMALVILACALFAAAALRRIWTASPMRRRTSPLASIGACALAAAVALGVVGGTASDFTDATGNTGNTFSAATVNSAPSVDATVVARNPGAIGALKAGASFYVYAKVSDDGRISSVKATLTNLTGSAAAQTLTAGSWTVGGVAYNYRSAQLTASGSLSGSSKSYTVTATDSGSLTGTATGSVAVDNNQGQPSSIQTINKSGGIAGRAEPGDKIVYTYNKAVDANSIMSGWDGSSTPVQVGIFDSGTDYLQVYAPSATTPTTPTNLGKLDLSVSGFTGSSGYAVFGLTSASGTDSTMALSDGGKTITVTLGSLDYGQSTTVTNFATERWAPGNGTLDVAGNSFVTQMITAAGGSHRAF